MAAPAPHRWPRLRPLRAGSEWKDPRPMMKTALYSIVGVLALAAQGAAPSYVLVQQWGEFGTKPGQFRFPTMIAVDRQSNLYVVDQHNHRVQKFDAEGRFLRSWGEQGNGSAQFNYPFGVAVNSRGEVYISDMNNHRIQIGRASCRE